MTEYTRTVILQGKNVILRWVGQISMPPARVYALAFTSTSELLLVSGGPEDPYCWLPGGGVEPGEDAEQALRRELLEEANAVIEAFEYLGSQRLEEEDGLREVQSFYWCRVTLAPQVLPRAESTLRHLVPPADFLDTLEWGRKDPKAPMLLERALACEVKYRGTS